MKKKSTELSKDMVRSGSSKRSGELKRTYKQETRGQGETLNIKHVYIYYFVKIYLTKSVVIGAAYITRTGVRPDSLKCMLTHGFSLPQCSGMFIWTHAINPELSGRQGWAWVWCRRPDLLQ